MEMSVALIRCRLGRCESFLSIDRESKSMSNSPFPLYFLKTIAPMSVLSVAVVLSAPVSTTAVAQPTSASIATPASPSLVAKLSPDLAFDEAKMRLDAQGGAASGPPGYRVHVKNLGLGASKSTTVTCTDVADWADTTPGPNMGKISRKTTSWSRVVPAIARGQSYTDQVEVFGNEKLVSRICELDPQLGAGDNNRANNRFTWNRPASPSAATSAIQPSVAAAVSPATVLVAPDLVFDAPAMISEIQNMVLIIKNVGATASTGGDLSCDADTQARLNTRLEQIKQTGTTTGTGVVGGTVPPIAAGQSVRIPIASWVYLTAPVSDIIWLRCGIGGVPGERNTANNSFQWTKPKPFSALDVQPERIIALTPDLVFDTANIRTDNYYAEGLTIKNVGRSASRAADLECYVSQRSSQPSGTPLELRWPMIHKMPAIAAGGSWTSPVNGPRSTPALTGVFWACTIDSAKVSGDSNVANNKHEFRWGNPPL